MLYLLLGGDDFSKKEYIEKLAKQKKLSLDFISETSSSVDFKNLLAPTLFGVAKIFVFVNAIGSLADEKILVFIKESSQIVIFTEEKLDKRKTQSQKLVKDKEITVKEFIVPTGAELEKWISDRVKALGVKMGTQAIKSLAFRLEGDSGGNSFKREEAKYNLWQVDNELKKLLTFANGTEITKEVINALVPEIGETESWDIVNALAEKQPAKAYSLMEKFFRTQASTDEKSKVIQLNSLLAEQFRSILLVKSFQNSGAQDTEILERTGWKSGRLYIVRKLASKFEVKKLQDFCSKLVNLDEQLKSTSTPARVLLDLITAQIVL